MYVIKEKLNHIPESLKEQLREIVKDKHNEFKLMVALYFMSELEDEECTLNNIEENLKKIYPNINYKDYQASVIRGNFNRETQKVKNNKILEKDRFYINTGKGTWKNSDKANQVVKNFLYENGFIVIKDDNYLSMSEKIEENTIKYMDDYGKTKEIIALARINQDKFRKKLLNKDPKCKICGMSNIELLIASHSKSWKESDEIEKLDENNGFMLCPNHDSLYDKHLITFDDDGKIMISKSLSEDDKKKLNIHSDIQIDVNEKQIKYIKHHREIFIKKESK